MRLTAELKHFKNHQSAPTPPAPPRLPSPLRIPYAPHGTAPFLILRAAPLHTPGAPAGLSGCSGGGSHRPQEARNTFFCCVVNIIKPGDNQRATLPVALLFLVS